MHDTEEIRRMYLLKKNEISARLDDFKKFRTASSEEIFYELCYCVITAHGSARQGRKAQACLEKNDFWKTGNILGCLDGVRYKENKEKFLLHNRKNIIEDKLDLREYLSGDTLDASKVSKTKGFLTSEASEVRKSKISESFSLRAKVAEDARHFKGLGWKASSQFLRNIGFSGLAILDRHILKALKEHGVIKEIPKSLTRKKYLEIEKQMQEFSGKIGVPMDALDIIFWTERSGDDIGVAK